MAELAALVERDTGTVSRWLKREDWPFAKRPPFKRADVPKILRWVADTLIVRESGEGDAAPGDEMKELRKQKLQKEIRKLHAQADAAETALARERGQLLDASDVEREWASIGVVMRNAFQNLAAQLLPIALTHGMPHQAAPAFQRQAEEFVTGILKRLSSDGTEDNSDGE